MEVGIVSKLALWYTVAIHLKLTVKTHNLQVQAKLLHKLCFSNY